MIFKMHLLTRWGTLFFLLNNPCSANQKKKPEIKILEIKYIFLSKEQFFSIFWK